MMNEKVERLVSWEEGKERGPYRLEIHPTNRCNLKCRMCGTRTAWEAEEGDMEEIIQENKQRELSGERLNRLVDEAAEMDVERVLLTGGGEPFIRKDLVLDLMQGIKDYDMFGNINTNGTLLREGGIRKIVDMEWDLMMFSIDSPYAETHDYMRNQENTFQRAVENIVRIQKYKEKIGSKKPEIALNSVLTKANYEELPELVKFVSRLGCNDLTIFPLLGVDKHQDLKVVNEKKLNRKIEKAKKIAEEENLHNNLEDVKRNETSEADVKEEAKNNKDEKDEEFFMKAKCFEPFLNMVVKMDGKVTPCCMIEEGQENIKDKPLEEVWTGDYYTKLRSNFSESGIPDICSECITSKETRNEEIRRKLYKIKNQPR